MKIGKIENKEIHINFWNVFGLYLGMTVLIYAIGYGMLFVLGMMVIGLGL